MTLCFLLVYLSLPSLISLTPKTLMEAQGKPSARSFLCKAPAFERWCTFQSLVQALEPNLCLCAFVWIILRNQQALRVMFGLCWMAIRLKCLSGHQWSCSVPFLKGRKDKMTESQIRKGETHGRTPQLKVLPPPPLQDWGWNEGFHLWTGPAFSRQSPVIAKPQWPPSALWQESTQRDDFTSSE